MNEELGGLTKEELQKKVTNKLAEIKLIFDIEGEVVTFTPQQAGIVFNENIIATDALKNKSSQNWLDEFGNHSLSLIYKHAPNYIVQYFEKNEREIPISYQIDEIVLTKFMDELSKKYHVEEKNAGLVMSGTEVKVIPAVYGKQLITGAIRTQIETALDAGQVTRIAINTEEVNPKILEKDVQDSVRQAQLMLERSVKLSYEDKKYQPEKAVIGSWIIFKEVGGVLKPEVSQEKIISYLNSVVAKEINIRPINEKVKITNGTKREKTRDGKNGLAVNVNQLANEIALGLNSNLDVNKEVPTYAVKYKTEVNNVLVADWRKYIEISIARQEMCAYLKGGEKINCWKITTGAAQWPTPRGTFLIMRKAGPGGAPGPYGGGVCMPNPPSTVPLCGINYVSYFTTAGHAIHEAYWRSHYGYNAFGNPNYAYNGSHGCINSTYDVAKWIYYWAPIGTPVVIH
jgi:hypothetical protein